MDDTCAVCADPLEWVAYGSCGHREVCSTCVVRLRFVLDDRRCCICKIESSTVFVTKAMGDYTRVITDFSAFPPGSNEGRLGEYWYHEDSQAYFDDADHYRMIKAMCKLSCSACDSSAEEQGGEGGKRMTRFRNVEQLKGHLFHRHKLFFCSLCLEGRKVFMCEQKLYTRAQLNRHISTGDSEVDGDESERGGFKGHPLCEFCKSPYYGENELYMHMSRDHYTCHMCQRRNPGHYDYFKNYDDLEIHFRQEHYICEDEVCLSEKFIVFQSEAELKRHNATKHGGHMSRSKRNAALVIPTSFRYQHSSEEEHRRGRGRGRGHGRGFRSDSSSNVLGVEIEASPQTSTSSNRVYDLSFSGPSAAERGERSQFDAVTGSFESLNMISDSCPPRSQTEQSSSAHIIEESSFPALSDREPAELPLRYARAVYNQSSGQDRLGESSFPPLPGASLNSMQGSKHPSNTFASRIGKSNLPNVRAAQSRSGGGQGSLPSSSVVSSLAWLAIQESASSSSASANLPVPSTRAGATVPSNFASGQFKTSRGNRFSSPTTAASKPWNSNKEVRLTHSSSAPDLVGRESLDNPVSSGTLPTSGSNGLPPSRQSLLIKQDVHTANKSLVEKIRAAFGMDEGKFVAFRSISEEYRQNLIDAAEYVSYVQQFGLLHLGPELAQLCPDPKKQKELIAIFKANKHATENGSSARRSESTKSGNAEGKSIGSSGSPSSRIAVTENILNTVRNLQKSYKPQEDVESLSKDGYRSANGRSASAPGRGTGATPIFSVPHANASSSGQSGGEASGKQRKKAAKFRKVRLGDGSAATLFNLDRADFSPEHNEGIPGGQVDGLSVRGVWKNGGGQRLFGTSSRDPSN